MNKTVIILLTTISLLLVKCGNDTDIHKKKQEIIKLREQISELKEQIEQIEKEIALIDTTAADKDLPVVNVKKAEYTSFSHYTEFRGSIKSLQNIKINAEVSGKVVKLKIKEGQRVAKDQTLVVIDPDIIEKQIKEVETALELATDLYEKQSNLWEKNIGTEVQYLQTKNNKEALETQLATLNAQLDLHYIKAPFDGTIENLNVREREIVQPGASLFNLQNHKELYIEADISEHFVGKISNNQTVEILIPVLEETIKSHVTSVGQIINLENRTFKIEIQLDDNSNYKPNLTAIITAKDYQNDKAITVSTKTIQEDAKGPYIYIAVEENNHLIAQRQYVKLGKSYNSYIEITEGIELDDIIITEGFRILQNGDKIKVLNND